MKSSVLVLLSLLLHYSNGARILAVLPLAAFSHQVMFKPILRELANRKHDVTVITSSPDDNANYKQIIVDNSYATSNINFFKLQNSHRFNTFISISRIGETTVHTVLKNPEVQRIIHSTDLQFDLILVEATFAQEALVVFGHKFRAPVVELVSTSSSFWLNELISNPNTFSYIVDCRTSSSDKMDFSERLSNTIGGIGALVLHRLSLLPRQEAIAKQYFNYSGWESRPPLIELLSNISLAIINTHVALHYPHPNNPNVIEVAGIHLKQPKKLPDELQIYLDNATEGVIYFSLGSNVKGSMMPEHVRRAFIQAFGKLPYKVLWKWDEKSLTGQTDNVKISKWLPQTDVLAHSNVKVFISHGGLLSITESVNHEVPMIIIPLFSDQWKNSIQAETAGFGITLKLDNITEDSVVWAVKEILTKSKYKEAARKHSSLLQDNPLKPLDTAIFWIEYVIRHQGAPHLQTAASRLYWYQYFLIDVVAVLVLGILTVLFLVYKVLKVIFFILLKITVSRKHVNTIKKNK